MVFLSDLASSEVGGMSISRSPAPLSSRLLDPPPVSLLVPAVYSDSASTSSFLLSNISLPDWLVDCFLNASSSFLLSNISLPDCFLNASSSFLLSNISLLDLSFVISAVSSKTSISSESSIFILTIGFVSVVGLLRISIA